MRPISKRKVVLFIGDIIIILFSFNLAILIRSGQTLASLQTFRLVALLGSLVVAYVGSFYSFELYSLSTKALSSKFLASMAGAFGLAYLFAILCFYIFPYKLGRGVFLISWVLTGILVFCSRFIYSEFFAPAAPRRNVLVLGNGATSETIIEAIKGHTEYNLVAILEKGSPVNHEAFIEKYVEEHNVTDIVVNFESSSSNALERALVNCRMRGIGCYTMTAFYERVLEKLPILVLDARWFLMSDGFEKLGNEFYRIVKRTTDFVVAGFVLVVTFPLFLIISALIPATSRGPIFFVQERLGVGRKPFRVIKFRTMVYNAEMNGPQWAKKKDGRVTALGKILRKARLDELPQFINVLKGEMSLIGPRPEREFFVKQLLEHVPFYSLRFFVKPGLTGWAQVKFRYGSDERDAIEKLRHDLYYIKNQSLFLDFRILMKTIRVVLMGLGT